jgi:hypothetical protein
MPNPCDNKDKRCHLVPNSYKKQRFQQDHHVSSPNMMKMSSAVSVVTPSNLKTPPSVLNVNVARVRSTVCTDQYSVSTSTLQPETNEQTKFVSSEDNEVKK